MKSATRKDRARAAQDVTPPVGYLQAIAEQRLIPRGVAVVVAVSGGLDSVVLLDLLARDAVAHDWRLVAAHLDHRLRGRQSRADSRWVRRVAGKYGFECVARSADVARVARRYRISIEMAARRARHEFLASVARRVHANHVALAHHADDQVELFFLRALRGTAAEGLGGMEPAARSPADPGIQLVRPLLNTPRRELRDYADRRGLSWREDASNADLGIIRNRLRHKLLPVIERHYQPALTEVIPRLMENLRVSHDWLRTEVDRLEQGVSDGFERLHPALQRELVHRQLVRLGVAVTTALIDQLRVQPPVPVVAPGGKMLVRKGMRIEIRAPRRPGGDWNRQARRVLELRGTRGKVEYGGSLIEWTRAAVRGQRGRGCGGEFGEGRAGQGVEWFDADRIGVRFVLRHWQPGDRFQPIGMGRPVKLQNLFVNLGIERSRRHELTVAEAADGGLFWVEGLRISECYRLDKDTRHLLKWQWRSVDALGQAAETPG